MGLVWNHYLLTFPFFFRLCFSVFFLVHIVKGDLILGKYLKSVEAAKLRQSFVVNLKMLLPFYVL
jgi:hypothetical protein